MRTFMDIFYFNAHGLKKSKEHRKVLDGFTLHVIKIWSDEKSEHKYCPNHEIKCQHFPKTNMSFTQNRTVKDNISKNNMTNNHNSKKFIHQILYY